MKNYILLGLLISLVTACSVSTKKAQSVPSNQSYLAPEPSAESAKEVPIGPPIMDTGLIQSSSQATVIGNAAAAALYGAVEGIAKVISNSDTKSAHYISGTCYYGEEEKQFATSPCSRVTVRLLDIASEKELAKILTTETGSFKFYVPSNKSYRLQVVDRRGRSAYLKQQVSRAETVSIYLKP
ncbi:MAG TPA: hypothetical protein VF412_06565 [Bdellovibrio sp.]|uniref:hypothetical protein n=1 Tax=Bdellovibrio sp. TaxID=28201 RepID=UPI002F1527FB